ncbi:MAG: response regulator transcription factor [Ferruginibacter sp.]
MEVKILIFEDNLLMQQSLCEVLQEEKNFTVAGTFENAANIDILYEIHQPDLLIMDIDMPEVNGLQGLEKLKSKYPEAKVLIFTVFEENDKVLNAICLGANGYILKSSSAQKIIESITDVMNGGAPLTPAIAAKILLHFPKPEVQNSNDELSNLSDKEKEVLELLVKGYSYKMIAAALFKSVETIRTQIRNIYRKLNVHSNAEAIIMAMNSKH